MSKAYDTVSSNAITAALHKRVEDSELRHMVLMLSRPMKVRVGDSPFRSASAGVPQGSPLIFNIVVQDFCDILWNAWLNFSDLKALLPGGVFADDVRMSAIQPAHLQTLLDLAAEWAHQVNLSWSPTKCVIVQPVVPGTSTPRFYLGGHELQTVGSTRYLGVDLGPEGLIFGKIMEVRAKSATVACEDLRRTGGRPRSLTPAWKLLMFIRNSVMRVLYRMSCVGTDMCLHCREAAYHLLYAPDSSRSRCPQYVLQRVWFEPEEGHLCFHLVDAVVILLFARQVEYLREGCILLRDRDTLVAIWRLQCGLVLNASMTAGGRDKLSDASAATNPEPRTITTRDNLAEV